jgi:competence protein ComEC
VPDAGRVVVFVAAAGVLLVLVAVRGRRIVTFAGMALLFVTAGIAVVYPASQETGQRVLEVTAIDVGQGDSLLVVSPEGKAMLIDAGGGIGPVHSEFDFGEDLVAPYLWSRGLNHLDVVVLTHGHVDHIGGLPRIIQDFQPAELWVGINPQTEALQRLYETADANHVAIRRHGAGEVLQWAGTSVRVLRQQTGSRRSDEKTMTH